jgi:hypothetical protein
MSRDISLTHFDIWKEMDDVGKYGDYLEKLYYAIHNYIKNADMAFLENDDFNDFYKYFVSKINHSRYENRVVASEALDVKNSFGKLPNYDHIEDVGDIDEPRKCVIGVPNIGNPNIIVDYDES